MKSVNPLPPTIRIAGRARCSFHVFGIAGLVAGLSLAAIAGARAGLLPVVLATMAALSCATFLGLAIATKAIAGEERLVYYHHEIAILMTCTAALAALGLPVRPYLDAAVAGLGGVLFFGRLGCSAVGCCYGRPARWGWRYGAAHVHAGFALPLRGVPLVPVQWMEAAGVGSITALAFAAIWRGAPAGTALCVYLGGYAVLRFGLEFWRGDPARRRWRVWTEAQWISIATLGLVLGVVELRLAIAPAFVVIAGLRRRRSDWLDAAHVREIAIALRGADTAGPPVAHCTSRGLRISKSVLDEGTRIYALSTVDGPPPPAEVPALSRMIALIEDFPVEKVRVIRGDGRVTGLVAPEVVMNAQASASTPKPEQLIAELAGRGHLERRIITEGAELEVESVDLSRDVGAHESPCLVRP